ncbi:MAG: calcium/sodium antiporter [Eubacteriales bacterium]|nr:calcium/sodium antiporter [Eubacteriales bacterium]
MLVTILLASVGLALLLGGAEWLVRGASRLARYFGVSPLVTGLTVVAIGTSAPELAASLISAFQGFGDIALGNVVGSNIVNIGLILGLTALWVPIRVVDTLNTRLIPFLLTVSTVLFLFSWTGFILSRTEGLALLFLLILFLAYTIRTARSKTGTETASETKHPTDAQAKTGVQRSQIKGFLPINVALILVGLVLLGGGANLFIRGAVEFARLVGISEAVIGVTVVALGTSLPELAASISAVRKRLPSMAVGNIVGSNIFNTLFIVGTPAALFPFAVSPSLVSISIPVMLGFTILLMVYCLTKRTVSRAEGGFLLLLVVLYFSSLLRFS